MTWTEERKERAKELWRDGFSASQIASYLGYVSRNAVLGVIHRAGLSGRGQPSGQIYRRTTPRARSTKVAKPIPKPSVVPKFEPEPVALKPPVRREPPSKGLSLLDLRETTCKWPHGDGPFTFCGHRSVEGSPYCAYHEERARA